MTPELQVIMVTMTFVFAFFMTMVFFIVAERRSSENDPNELSRAELYETLLLLWKNQNSQLLQHLRKIAPDEYDIYAQKAKELENYEKLLAITNTQISRHGEDSAPAGLLLNRDKYLDQIKNLQMQLDALIKPYTGGQK